MPASTLKSKLIDLLFKAVCRFFRVITPIRDRVLIVSHSKIEDNAVEMANYLAENYDFKIGLMFSDKDLKSVKNLKPKIHPAVSLHSYLGLKPFRPESFRQLFGSKYILFTQLLYPFDRYLKNQITVNLWHGVGHKKINTARGYKQGVPANYTIATSKMTQKMFADLFANPIETVFIGGMPRNDLMLRTKNSDFKFDQNTGLNGHDRIIIWMPTFRRKVSESTAGQTVISETDNIFGIDSFNIERFNQMLKQYNTICVVKSHYYVNDYKKQQDLSNFLFINDNWLYEHGILLYELLSKTDALITDYSSVMTDYSLLDRPIFVIAEDLEYYKKSQGLYFEDYENRVPSKLFLSQNELFDAVRLFLENGDDKFAEKRRKIRDLYYQFKDEKSAERISKFIFKDKLNQD